MISKLLRQLGHCFFLIIRNRNRSLLTVLGIILSTTLYTASVLSLNNIMEKEVHLYRGFPEGVIFIDRAIDFDELDSFSNIYDDVNIHPFYFSSEEQTEYQNNNEYAEDLMIQRVGVNRDYLNCTLPSLDVDDSLEQTELIGGRLFTESDFITGNNVLHLYEATAKLLFGFEDPLGQIININGVEHIIIGILKDTPDVIRTYSSEIVEPLRVYVPMDNFSELSGYSKVILQFPNATSSQTDKEVKDFFKAASVSMTYNDIQRKVNFDIENTKETIDTVLILLLIISSISIMVIMVFGIKERVFEFGIKRAVGASDGDITLQIVIESLILGTIGALIGIGIGILLSFIISVYLISSFGMFIYSIDFIDLINPLYYSLLFTLIFSFIPAIVATRINIVTALKTD